MGRFKRHHLNFFSKHQAQQSSVCHFAPELPFQLSAFSSSMQKSRLRSPRTAGHADSSSLLHEKNRAANNSELYSSCDTDLHFLGSVTTAVAGGFEEDGPPPPPPPSRGRVVSVQQFQPLQCEQEQLNWSHAEARADCSLCISSEPRSSGTLGLDSESRYFMLPVAVQPVQAS